MISSVSADFSVYLLFSFYFFAKSSVYLLFIYYIIYGILGKRTLFAVTSSSAPSRYSFIFLLKILVLLTDVIKLLSQYSLLKTPLTLVAIVKFLKTSLLFTKLSLSFKNNRCALFVVNLIDGFSNICFVWSNLLLVNNFLSRNILSYSKTLLFVSMLNSDFSYSCL